VKICRLEEKNKVVIPIHVPFVSADKLADLWTPQENDLAGDVRPSQMAVMKTSIVNQVYNNVLPAFHIGKRLAINLVQLAVNDSHAVAGQSLQLEFSILVPSLPLDVFADHTGFRVGVIDGWIKKGYLPSVKRGDSRMVSIAHLLDRCLTWSPEQWSALVDRTLPTQSTKRSPVLEAV